ncbi:MAG: hypothetical protein HETSPECPRED_000778 [Heterodermia speciosa]|uniref:Heat shock factor binding protein 1 n=1 Tax=Heterodermia speciosa TaxID=116794 RepID=A0A8H3GD76_9LECA|nr:MAG: hypothetical protein HETSPECPRED_000778 [Heterodermia speciosa]
MATQEQDSVSEDGHLHVAALPSPEANDLIKAVDEMLETMTTKFNKISTEVLTKMDEMAQRIDDLEAAIKAGSDQTTSDGVGS